MRQLDLFGSFYETPEENKPEEKQAVPKKDQPKATSEIARPAYSKNALRSERAVENEVIAHTNVVQQEKEERGDSLDTPGHRSSISLLSLFDDPIAQGEFETEETDLAIEKFEELSVAVDEPDESTPINDPSSEVVPEEQESLIVDRTLAEPILPATIAEPDKAEEKPVSIPKPKKPVLPELQRTGDVIFDDGKITVKIKNKSPFPPPIVKEKKAKVKKPVQKRGRKSFKEIDAEVDLIEVPDDEILFQKQYYAISEVAKWFRVNTSLLRFWENEFDVLKPRKNRKGDRLFRPEDVKNLQLIYQLLRQRKYTIDGAKEYIKTNKKKADIQLQLTNTLQKFRGFLLDLKANLQP